NEAPHLIPPHIAQESYSENHTDQRVFTQPGSNLAAHIHWAQSRFTPTTDEMLRCRLLDKDVLALSQENRRFLSCHGQISCKVVSPGQRRWRPGVRQSLLQGGAAIQTMRKTRMMSQKK